MKKKLPEAKGPLPKFSSDNEAAKYFDTHSVEKIWDQLPKSPAAKLSPALANTIRERHVRAKTRREARRQS
jgi:hypothetical protein